MTHEQDLAVIARDFPSQTLDHFTDQSGWFVTYLRGHTVFYLSANGSEWCPDCANQDAAEPPIIAGQITGKVNEAPRVVHCAGCQVTIHPVRIIRQNSNARYIYNFETGTVLSISYETPVAMYLLDSNTIYQTDINWSKSLSKNLQRFRDTMNEESWKRLNIDPVHPSRQTKATHPRVKIDTCPQEQLDDILKKWTGRSRLPETRGPRDNYNQGVKHRVDTSVYVEDYTMLRKELASRKTDRYVICE